MLSAFSQRRCVIGGVQALSSSSSSSSTLADGFQGEMILAPLTRGGNYPFRRLCQEDFGCRVVYSEMIFARPLLKGDPVERARLRRVESSSSSALFGVQIATNNAAEGAAAMALAQQEGKADFVDLNTGCPLYEATRRGLGSALLRNPERLGSLVHDMLDLYHQKKQGSSATTTIPLTVKVRLGCEASGTGSGLNVLEVARAVREAGAAALTIHGRTAQQGYKQSADWEWIQKVVAQEHSYHNNNPTTETTKQSMPIIGNGDILTHYEAQRRMQESGVNAIMVGRGALIKPWIFQEFRESQEWHPSEAERIAIYRKLATYCKEYFGNDDVGRKLSWKFLPWHFNFFSRYMAFPEEEYGSMTRPLLQSRIAPPDELSPLATLLLDRHEQTHDIIANILWDADSDAHAVSQLSTFAESAAFADIQNHARSKEEEEEATKELSNIPKKRERRRTRIPKPKRTLEEIEAIRAERAAKRAAAGITHVHVEGVRREN